MRSPLIWPRSSATSAVFLPQDSSLRLPHLWDASPASHANVESHCLAAHLFSREALDSIKHFNPSDGVRVLGSFLGSHDAIQTVLRTFIVKSIQQLDLLSQLGDFQCMYLLLRYCVCAQFSFLLQTLPYSHTASFVSALTDIFARFVFQTLLYPELATSAISPLVA